jgi:DNA-binding XRE family transcriptional regulator
MKRRDRFGAISHLVMEAETDTGRTAMTEAPRKEEPEKCQGRSVFLPSLRELRQSRGLTQRELGKLANVSTNTIYQLEIGLRGSYPSTMRKLALALEVSPSELVQGHRRE